MDSTKAMEAIIEFLQMYANFLYNFVLGCIQAVLPSSLLPHKDIKGNLVLITGAASGIGRETAREVSLNSRVKPSLNRSSY